MREPEPRPGRAGEKRCSRCGKAKNREAAFYVDRKAGDGRSSWCKACVRMAKGEACTRPEEKARAKAYQARPEVRERRLAYDRARRPAHYETVKRYQKTVWGRLVAARRANWKRLSEARDPAARARLMRLIETQTRELDRMARAQSRAVPALKTRGEACRPPQRSAT